MAFPATNQPHQGRCLLTFLPALLIATFAACAPDAPVTAPQSLSVPSLAAGGVDNGQGTQACAPDTKLLGRIAVSTADAPGTWWRLTKDRFNSLGLTTDAQYKAALEGFYGQSFTTLDAAVEYLIDGVATFDTNGNGYVCGYDVRGTRAWLGDNALLLFSAADDKHFRD